MTDKFIAWQPLKYVATGCVREPRTNIEVWTMWLTGLAIDRIMGREVL